MTSPSSSSPEGRLSPRTPGQAPAQRSQGNTFSSQPNYAQTTPVVFNSGTNSTVTLYIGFFGDGQDQFIQVDDVSLTQR